MIQRGKKRGVYDAWRDPVVFFEWAYANGYEDDLELDRIENDKGYFPDNCRFVTHLANNNNRTDNLIVEIDGQKMTFADAHRRYGVVDYERARMRYQKSKWNIMKALTQPLDKRQSHKKVRT